MKFTSVLCTALSTVTVVSAMQKLAHVSFYLHIRFDSNHSMHPVLSMQSSFGPIDAPRLVNRFGRLDWAEYRTGHRLLSVPVVACPLTPFVPFRPIAAQQLEGTL